MNAFPTPPQLMQQFEQGLLTREELHEAMAHHGRDLIREMEYEHENREESFIERWRCKRHAARFANRHGEAIVREVLSTLAALPGFPPANLLWNASHSHVPLFCFFRLKRTPLFLIRTMRWRNARMEIEVEYSGANNERKTEQFLLERGRRWDFQITSRNIIS